MLPANLTLVFLELELSPVEEDWADCADMVMIRLQYQPPSSVHLATAASFLVARAFIPGLSVRFHTVL